MTDSTSQDAGHVLTAIDHALDDYETSADAMRWTPEADDIAPPVAPPLPTLTHLGQVVVRITVDTLRFEAAMRQVAETMQQVRPWSFTGSLRLGGPQRVEPDAHRVGPMPLPIDGHAYHRRQRARRRR